MHQKSNLLYGLQVLKGMTIISLDEELIMLDNKIPFSAGLVSNASCVVSMKEELETELKPRLTLQPG